MSATARAVAAVRGRRTDPAAVVASLRRAVLAGIDWPRGLALLLTGGPLFILPRAAGYFHARLAHGGVIAPAMGDPYTDRPATKKAGRSCSPKPPPTCREAEPRPTL